MRKVIHNDGKNVSTLIREDGVVAVETVSDDAKDLDFIKRVRDEELVQMGDANPMVDGGETIYHVRFPTDFHYREARRAYPELFHDIEQGTQHEREIATQKLIMAYPMYLMSTKRKRYF